MERERIAYLDTIKAGAILLVVFCHFTLLPDNTVIGNVIMSFAWCAVPCFMMTSGALMHRNGSFSWKKYFGKLVKTYLVLCIWRGLYFAGDAIFLGVRAGKATLFQFLFLFGNVDGVDIGVLWYMAAYLSALLLYPMTYFLMQSGKGGQQALLFLTGILFFVGIFLPECNWLLSYLMPGLSEKGISVATLSYIIPFANYSHTLFYFLLGALLYRYESKLREVLEVRKGLLLLGMVVGCVLLIMVKYTETGLLVWGNSYLTSGYTRFGTLVLSFCIYEWFAMNPTGKIKQWMGQYVGKYTMGIYYMHYWLLNILAVYLYPHITQWNSVILNLCKTILVTAICVLVTAGMRKIPVIKELVR